MVVMSDFLREENPVHLASSPAARRELSGRKNVAFHKCAQK
jgi:hypothetical protein